MQGCVATAIVTIYLITNGILRRKTRVGEFQETKGTKLQISTKQSMDDSGIIYELKKKFASFC